MRNLFKNDQLHPRRYAIQKRLRRGATVSVFVTMRCDLDCPYCSLMAYNSRHPKECKIKEIDSNEWISLLTALFNKVKIREIIITGGEPTLEIQKLEAIADFCIMQDKCVQIHTNLWDRIDLKSSWGLRILATYHSGRSKENALELIDYYRKQGHIVSFKQDGKDWLGDRPEIVTPFEEQGKGMGGQKDRLCFSPDGKLFVRMEDFYRHIWGGK